MMSRLSKIVFSAVAITFVSLVTYSFAEEPSPEIKAKAVENYGKLPLTFVKNKGQTDTTVLFYISGKAGSVFFTQNAVVTELVKREKPESSKTPGKMEPPSISTTEPVVEHRLVLRKTFLGSNLSCKVIGENELPGKVNVFRGNDPSKWQQNISTYQKIRYQKIYPGMDIVFQGDNGNLSYTLFLSPKAEINPFKFKIEGADKIAINKDGDLEIKTSFGTFLEKQPSAYQEKDGIKITVSSKLVILKKNQVGFKIGKYNKSLPLVIE